MKGQREASTFSTQIHVQRPSVARLDDVTLATSRRTITAALRIGARVIVRKPEGVEVDWSWNDELAASATEELASVNKLVRIRIRI